MLCGLIRSTLNPDPPVGVFLLHHPRHWFTTITWDAIKNATATITLKLSEIKWKFLTPIFLRTPKG